MNTGNIFCCYKHITNTKSFKALERIQHYAVTDFQVWSEMALQIKVAYWVAQERVQVCESMHSSAKIKGKTTSCNSS